ncbi:Hypothetical protein NTJ_10348 [Nesidiocoris tenuis]|uniref:Phospholipase A2-like domain-containing protein n=1 Tax=Nesidiocoris tenuis TaxID=355587 RepID=A0ABN7B163_9HEMI|nr:Hypothetical protein NTJ_10348 [Nesidiocoris tenuis]
MPTNKFLFPGCNYLGPGNPLENGKPTCYADSLARQHDHEYDRAVCREDVREADRKFIKGCASRVLVDPLTPGAVPALVGAVGISAKYLVETGTGTLYPWKARQSRETVLQQSREAVREYHKECDRRQEEREEERKRVVRDLASYHQNCENASLESANSPGSGWRECISGARGSGNSDPRKREKGGLSSVLRALPSTDGLSQSPIQREEGVWVPYKGERRLLVSGGATRDRSGSL